MTAVAIIVPTIGRESLAATLFSVSLQTQDGDWVLVMCDEPTAFDRCQQMVEDVREAGAKGIWRCFPPEKRLGCFGHGQRNRALDLLGDLEEPPGWVWSLDDDDVATFGALDMIRAAVESKEAEWYCFRMVGGGGSHFPGTVVPATEPWFQRGNVGTPMMVFPLCETGFGMEGSAHGDGYFGDWELAEELQAELGDPVWRDVVVCEVRPVAVAA